MVEREGKRVTLKSRNDRMEDSHENVSLRHSKSSLSLTRVTSSWRKLLAAVWGVRAQEGTFLCESEKSKLVEKKGKSAGQVGARPARGWSSSGQRVMRASCSHSPMLLPKRDSKELPDVEENALSSRDSFPHAGTQTTGF